MPYLVMEYVHGKALHYSSHGICIDPAEAAELTLGICEGLAHAHEAGILHRDIKPANILLDARKHPKVGDFGLAYAIGAEEGGELLFGTPGYSAPEVLNNPGKIAKQSDVFSIGVLFYELLTGELPGEQYVPVSQKVAVDPRFDQLIRRATHPNPDLRISDAGAMAAEVRQLLKSQPKALVPTIKTRLMVPGATAVVNRRVASPVPKLVVTEVGFR
jgi:serine/threonine-protein kinase